MYSHYQLIQANNFWQRQGRYVGGWWGEARTPSLLFASGHHSQVPEMFGPYFEIPPSTCARGWPQLQQPGGQVGTSGGSGWLAQATAWWWGSLGYIHGAVPSALFHSKKLRDASSEHWDGAVCFRRIKKKKKKKSPCKHFGENGKSLRTWHWNDSLDLAVWCSVLLLSLISFICLGHETL